MSWAWDFFGSQPRDRRSSTTPKPPASTGATTTIPRRPLTSVTEHYDVIIIGSGAGGGTLAHTLAGVRQADPAPRAGRLPAARDGQLGSRARCSSRAVHLDGHLVRRRRQGVPAAGPLLRRRGHQALRRRAVPAAPAGLRRAAATSTACRRRGRSTTTTSSPGTRRPSGCTRCTATAARTRPRGTARSPTRGRPSRTSRASSRSPTSWPPAGYHPFHAPCGVLLDEADRARSTCIRCTWCDGYPVPRARQGRRRDDRRPADPRPPQRDAARRRRGDPAGHRRQRAHGHRVWS